MNQSQDDPHRCPFCDEVIRPKAKRCRHCHAWLGKGFFTGLSPEKQHLTEQVLARSLQDTVAQRLKISYSVYGLLFASLLAGGAFIVRDFLDTSTASLMTMKVEHEGEIALLQSKLSTLYESVRQTVMVTAEQTAKVTAEREATAVFESANERINEIIHGRTWLYDRRLGQLQNQRNDDRFLLDVYESRLHSHQTQINRIVVQLAERNPNNNSKDTVIPKTRQP